MAVDDFCPEGRVGLEAGSCAGVEVGTVWIFTSSNEGANDLTLLFS